VSALPSFILEPLWVQVAALLPARQVHHPPGCHRARIADHSCSATTLPRRRDEWITAGVAEQLRLTVLAAYDRMHGLELEQLAVDGCTTKAPCGGQVAGPSPVDRGKQGLKRSVAVEAGGIPLAAVPAPANQRDDGLLPATLDTIAVVGPLPAQPVVHLDAGYDRQPCRQVLTTRGMVGQIATRGVPAPVQAGRRCVIERTHAWGNQYGKLRWCTERRRVVEFWLLLALALIVVGRLLRRAWTTYRWEGRPAAARDRRRAEGLSGLLEVCTQRSGSHGELPGAAVAAPGRPTCTPALAAVQLDLSFAVWGGPWVGDVATPAVTRHRRREQPRGS
jgi:transposase